MSTALEVFSDLSERLNYNLPDFPLYVRKGTLRQFDRYAAACHWHPELEFILALKGSMEYFINGQTVHIAPGNGIFVNSKRLHYGFSSNETDCSYIVAATHPALFGESKNAVTRYWEDKFGGNTEDYILLDSQTPWQKEVLLLLIQMYDEMHSNTVNPLQLLSQSASLCAHIGKHIHQVFASVANEKSWRTIQEMTGYIHKHYDLKITLDDIAASGTVCRSRCCELFRRYIGQTPNNYLIQYRIQKSCEMLLETDRSICEIAIACGFESASYYSYTFRKAMSLVPQEFRKRTPAS